MTEDPRPAVVLYAGTPYDGPTLSDQPVAAALADRGNLVVYVDPPQRLSRGRLARPAHVRHVRENVLRVTPFGPRGAERPVVVRFVDYMVKRAVVAALQENGSPRHVSVLTVKTTASAFADIGQDQTVYWAKDDYTAAAALLGQSSRLLARNERRARAHSDIVVAVSEALVEHWSERGKPVVLIPPGCDVERFRFDSRKPVEYDFDRPVLIFSGHISDRIDFLLLQALVDAGQHLLLIGPQQRTFTKNAELDRLLMSPNVDWIRGVAQSDLPSYLSRGAVGLVPYTLSRFNKASAPLKVNEYLASGMPVVTTLRPGLSSEFVFYREDVQGFVRAAESLVDKWPQEELRAACRESVASETWSARAELFAAVLGVH